MSRVALIGAGAIAIALATVLSASGHKVVMPERRRELEPGYDMNLMLDDAGRRAERKARKAERKARMQNLQRAALDGSR